MNVPVPIVAVTGGIASGKSAIANEFLKLGVPVIDTDLIARQVVEPGQPALQAIVEHFGKEILDSDGRLDRKHLRRRIFENSAEKQHLEGILHPLIRREQQHQAAAAGGTYQIHVIPLLYEGMVNESSGDNRTLRQKYNRVLVVDCPRDIQLQRLIARDGITTELANRMLDAQATREQRLSIATEVIENTGNLEYLHKQVAALHQRYLKDLAKSA